MTRWSYMVTKLVTQELVARHVPMTGVSFSDSLLGGGGTFQASFDVNRTEFAEWVSQDQMRRVIWPCRDGIPQGAYLLTACPTVDGATTSQPIRGVRLDWLFTRRAITKTLTFAGVDQNRIIRDLFRFGMGRLTSYASPNQRDFDEDLPRAQIPWIGTDPTLSGVPRTRQETTGNTDDGYPGSSRKVVAQMVENITKLEQGPEYRWLYRLRDDGWPEMMLDTAGPSLRVGRSEAEAAITFEYPAGRKGSVDSASYGSDGTPMTTRAHVIGQKQDTDIPVGMARYDELLDQEYPLLDRVVTESSVQSEDVLAAKASGLLWAADDAWSVALNGGGNPSWGSYQIGDWVVLRVRQGRTPRRRSMRITGWTIDVDDSGFKEKVKPTLQVGKWFG